MKPFAALAALLMAASGAGTAEPLATELRVTDFGALCDGKSDDFPAFVQAIAALPPNGGTLAVPMATCRLSSTLHISKPVRLAGAIATTANFGRGQPGSVLAFDSGHTGIIIDRRDTLEASGSNDGVFGGDDSIIENVLVRSSRGKEIAHGVWLRARATLRNMSVEGFSGNGVRILASAKAPGEMHGNANNWRMDKVRITGSGSDGLFIDGSDVNAGVAIEVDSSANGGWGIFDSSFLGNTYVGTHAAANGSGAYKTDGINARNVFVGCYSEGGQPPSQLVSPTLVVGGLHGAGFSAGSTHGHLDAKGWNATQPFTFSPRGDNKNQSLATVVHGAANEIFGLHAFADHPRGVELSYVDGAYEWRSAGLDNRRAQIFTSELNDGRIVQIALKSGGTGYTHARASFSGGGGQGANAEVEVVAGAVTAVRLTNGGSGYSSAPATTIEGDGTGAIAVASVTHRILAGRASPLPPGQTIFPQGIFIGAGSNPETSRLQTNSLAMPTQGTFASGDFVWNRTPTLSGTPGSHYLVLGWSRLTAGSSHVPNVDWAEARLPLGN